MVARIQTTAWPRKGGLVSYWRAVLAHRELFEQLVWRNIKVRYTQSILGIYWAIINPLLLAAVLYLAFSIFVRVPTNGTPYLLFVLCGLLPWNFLAHALTDATQSLVAHVNVITKVPFPREIIPAAEVFARLVDFCFSAVILLLLLPVFGQSISLSLLWLPILLFIQLLFALGLAFITSMANLFFRDVRQLVTLLLTLWMFLTPVIYPTQLVPAQYRSLYMLNPMASLITSYRNVILDGISPDWRYLGYTVVISVILLAVSYLFFKKNEPLFAERV